MEIEQQPQRDVQQFHVTLQQSWPHDPVHFDGGANDLTGESVSFGEIRVHGVGLILEQKETKETKNASHRILRHIYQYQFVKIIFSPCLTSGEWAASADNKTAGPSRAQISLWAAAGCAISHGTMSSITRPTSSQ